METKMNTQKHPAQGVSILRRSSLIHKSLSLRRSKWQRSRVVANNEEYRGSVEDVEFISEYLQSLRSSTIANGLKLKQIHPLSNLLSDHSQRLGVNNLLFEDTCSAFESDLKKICPTFHLLDTSRIFVGILEDDDEDTGGFHSRYAKGFQYLSWYGFSVLLNKRLIENDQLITLELARNYLHDSIHAATFKSFRKMPQHLLADAKSPVFREQYGFNFRKPTGMSYSSPSLTRQGPSTINLNLLMDGITVLITIDEMRKVAQSLETTGLIEIEQEVMSDLVGDLKGITRESRIKKFHDRVTLPTTQFLSYWGDRNLMGLLFTAMITGKMKAVTQFFNEKLRMKGAWKHLFLSPSWM
jgi:hypothetical protein